MSSKGDCLATEAGIQYSSWPQRVRQDSLTYSKAFITENLARKNKDTGKGIPKVQHSPASGAQKYEECHNHSKRSKEPQLIRRKHVFDISLLRSLFSRTSGRHCCVDLSLNP